MATSERHESDARVDARNIGGISETSVELEPGINVLVGRNATNRTSFLKALMASLGSETTTLKRDATEGTAMLTLGGNRHERTLRRNGDTVIADGEPYLDDPELADLYAFLVENNEARRAIETGSDLREIIMRPVDTNEIEAEIERLTAERDRLDDELSELDHAKSQLPDLKSEREQLTREIEETSERLTDVKARIDAANVSISESREQTETFEEKLTELRDTRRDLEELRSDLDIERESLTALRTEKDEITDDMQATPGEQADAIDAIEEQTDELRDHKRELDAEVSDLQSIIRFNRKMLDSVDEELFDAIETPSNSENGSSQASGSVTDQLLDQSRDGICWTCGSSVEYDAIESTVEKLEALRQTKLQRRSEVESNLAELKEQREEIRDQQRRATELQDRFERITDEIDQRQGRIESLERRRDDLLEEVQRLEGEVELLRSDDYSDVLELHKQANRLELDLEELETDREDVESEIADIQSRIQNREQLQQRREQIQSDLLDQRNKIDDLELEAIETYNEHMETVLDVLGYDNIERIWIERTTQQQTRRRDTEASEFEFHVVRSGDNGVYEDTVEHLSESEREVAGLIFALAGYLVHDVHDTVPFVLLDSLEAIDSDRIARLLEYFSEYAEYLVVALLPADAEALDDRHRRIETI